MRDALVEHGKDWEKVVDALDGRRSRKCVISFASSKIFLQDLRERVENGGENGETAQKVLDILLAKPFKKPAAERWEDREVELLQEAILRYGLYFPNIIEHMGTTRKIAAIKSKMFQMRDQL